MYEQWLVKAQFSNRIHKRPQRVIAGSRLYIVGIKQSLIRQRFLWPLPARRLHTLDSVLSKRCGGPEEISKLTTTRASNLIMMLQKLAKKGIDPMAKNIILDAGGSKPHWMEDVCPCLTATRASDQAFWSSSRSRFLSVNEMKALQGVPRTTFAGWKSVLSARQMGKIVGNAMPVCVYERVMRAVLTAMGIPVR